MNQLLQQNAVLKTETSKSACRVEKFLGGGGQGEVYRAQLEGRAVALKWYFARSATQQQRWLLETLVQRPAPSERFLWPLELVSDPKLPGFGYVMGLRQPRYRGIVDLMKRRIEPTFKALITAGYQLADSYYQLHSSGLCYRDISFGNVFFDPDTGDVLICDNDNVSINNEQHGGVLGTPKFMAPEVVRGEALPSRDTDLYSLAVLLFYMLIVQHPLDGKRESRVKCLDLPAMNKIYGFEPVFIFDPQDDSNRPDPDYHRNALEYWPLYPEFLRQLFVRSFTDGIRDPRHGRVKESEWRTALVRLRDAIAYCPGCGGENFFSDQPESAATNATCWSCQAAVRWPLRLVLNGKHVVMLNHDTKLYPHHLDPNRSHDFSEAAATVQRHPTDPSVWGLKNLTAGKWTAAGREGSMNDVPAGRSVTLARGLKLNFGNVSAEIA